MKITPHRGTHQIGGTCIELQSGDTRIVVDIGIPLTDVSGERYNFGQFKGLSGPELVEKDVLPSVKGLYSWDKHSRPVDAIFISHSHKDHYGFLPYVSKSIPVYMSEGCKKLLGVAYYFGQSDYDPEDAVVIKSWEGFKAGDFTVTPYLVDHSAVDAFAYLVDAGGKKVFYSGDFRGHGRKSVLFTNIKKSPPKGVDCLILEGTCVHKDSGSSGSEADVEKELIKIFKENRKLIVLSCSHQNVDRISSLYRACIRTGKTLVMIPYTAYILDKLKSISKKIPQYDIKQIKVFFEKSRYSSKMRKDKTLYKYRSSKIKYEEIERRRNELVVLNSFFVRSRLGAKGLLKDALLVYSNWVGYFEDEKPFWEKHGVPIKYVHTSGHASVAELEQFANAINPVKIIPIHTNYPEMFHKLFGSKVIDINDEESIEI